MTNLIEAIDNFYRTYLEQREDNAWDLRTHGPLRKNRWAQKALKELLVPKGYTRMRRIEEEELEKDADFVRYNPDESIDRVFLGDDLNLYQKLFGNTRYMLPENKNTLLHLRFSNTGEAERYEQLKSQMWELADAEGATHREGVAEYRPLFAFLGGSAGGVLSVMLAAASIPWKDLIGLDSSIPYYFAALSLMTFGAVGGWNLGKHKMSKMSKYKTKLKIDYDPLFSEFKDTFGSRFTYGKEALRAALGV